MITDNQVQEALDWMIKNEDALAEAKAAYHDLDRFSKTIKAELMSKISSNMSVAARETEALANEEYKTHLDNLRIAEEQYLKYEYKMDHNKLICQLWQTISANKRQSI
jgi:polyhydroxyalkanoate synthesis regulator phasin